MRILNRLVVVALGAGLMIGAVVLSAQDAVSEVRKAVDDGRAAAAAADVKAYERIVADDLRWINGDGSVWSKQERLKALSTSAPPPTIEQVGVKVYGDTATVVAVTQGAGGPGRLVRTYVKRDGRWLLVLHAAVPMKK